MATITRKDRAMQRYWDLTEQQRADLEATQVEGFLDRELMEKGVIKVEAPTLEPMQEIELPKTGYFAVHKTTPYGSDYPTGYCFNSLEDAQKFIDSNPIEVENEWTSSTSYARPCRGMSIHAVKLLSEQEYLNNKVRIDKNAETKKRNDAASKDYESSCTKLREATDGVWSDWREQRAAKARHERVMETKREYVEICDGNERTAMKFLEKAHGRDAVAAAYEWFGLPCATEELVEAF